MDLTVYAHAVCSIGGYITANAAQTKRKDMRLKDPRIPALEADQWSQEAQTLMQPFVDPGAQFINSLTKLKLSLTLSISVLSRKPHDEF